MQTQDSKNSTSCNTKERGRCWILTINNYSKDDLSKLEELKEQCQKYTWQSEEGENETEHLQICLWFKNQKTFSQMKKHFPRAHIEKAMNWNACLNYCKKLKTFNGKIREVQLEEPDKLNVCTFDPMENLELKDWQILIKKIIAEKPDARTIYWFWEPDGGVGKTTFVKSLIINCSDYIYISGKVADIKYGITKYILDRKKAPKVIFMNVPRSVEHISYNGLEQVKDGIFYNTKYESGMVRYDYPHVIVFANEEPSLEMMSVDRWKIIRIN